MLTKIDKLKFVGQVALCWSVSLISASAQNPQPNNETLKKANNRPAEATSPQREPFDGALIEKMTGQCVTLETEQGAIVIEMLPAGSPETVCNFLNLAVSVVLDTTPFILIVKDVYILVGYISSIV